MRLIGVDVGGTFTDLVFADTEAGRTEVHKISTTPDDPSRGVVQGLMALCDKYSIPRETIDTVFHGTTIATNAILEHDGAVTGMITTGGFRDILHIGRHQRPQHYSIMQDIPWQDRPLVKRRHRKVVTERLVPPRGEVLEPLDEDGVRQAVRELKEPACRPSRSASSSPISTRATRRGRWRSCARNIRSASPPPPRPSRRSSASSSDSRPRR
jgi:N-methylhydantoinase A